ncbi:hypothetical protein [Salinicoccus sp. YB14-2]|uniref:hypothetical protein n=1 Tax=Salinicoccus sp. YB14-2 TaxID=1572701 RepID=UPI00068B5859|nr:hypothetical protein [Salinicoccus sp. YB14-2]
MDSADAEKNYSEGSKVLDRILSEFEDYKKSLEAKGIKLNISRSEKNLQATDYGLDTIINVEGIKERIEILFRKNMVEFELKVRDTAYLLPVDKATDNNIYVVEDTQEINSMSYGEFIDIAMQKLLGEK